MRRPTLTATFLLAAALLSAASARAGEADTEEPAPIALQPRPLPEAAPPAGARTWYGWQIMLADAASFLCVGATEQEACLAGFALSGPVVHTLHGNPGRGIVSLGLRVGLPIIGGLIGSAAADCREPAPMTMTAPGTGDGHGAGFGTITLPSFCGLSEVGLGMMAGAATAMVADGIMAFGVRAPAPPPESVKPSRFSITPRLGLGQSNVAMGITGTF
jgi:hypothetical protein